jgi:hypothetical protein
MSTSEIEDALWETLRLEEERQQSARITANPNVAQRVGQIHSQYPFLSPGVKLSAAKAELTDDQVIAIANGAAPIYDDVNNQKKKQKSWFERNIQDKVKTVSRYGFAAAEFPVQMTVGAVAQIFDTDDSVKGWFISTDLGSLIANDEEAGTGFFIGGRAKELQGERAKRYRGEINGEAFTIGRGLANVLVKENTVPYRLLSGAVDAVTALTVPIAPAAKGVGEAARVAQQAGSTSKVVGAVADASRIVGKGSKEIGITELSADARKALQDEVGLVGDSVDLVKANRFFSTGKGRRLIERTAETDDFAETFELWGRKIDPATAMRLADAKTEPEVMATVLDILGTQVTSSVGLRGTRRVVLSTRMRNEIIQKIPLGEGTSRAFAKLPRVNINLFQAETPREQIEQLDTVDRALKLFKITGPKVDKDGKVIVEDLRRDFMNRAAKLVTGKNEVEINKFYSDLEEEMKNVIVRSGVPRENVDEIYKNFARFKDDSTVFTADDLGVKEDMGLYKKFHGLTDVDDDMIIAGGLTVGELATKEFFIPDPKQFRRLTNDLNWIWVKKDPNLASLGELGELRFPFAAAEKFQEEIWRKYITATIGNFARNTIDSTISLYLSGKGDGYSALRHPFEWFQMVGNPRFKNTRLGRGDLLAQDWDAAVRDGLVGEAIQDFRAATGDIVEAHFKDPLQTRRRAQRLGIFKPYSKRTDIVDQDFVKAHGDEIGRLNADWSMRQLAGGKTIDEVIDLIRSGDEDAVRWYETIKTSYKNGKPIYNKTTGNTVWESIDLDASDNLKYLLEANTGRLMKITGQDPRLMDVVSLGLLKGKEQVVDSKWISGDISIGNRVEVSIVRNVNGKKVKDKYLARVDDIIRTAKGEQVSVTPYAFDGVGDNSRLMRELLSSDDVYKNPNMPRTAVGEIRNPDTPQSGTMMRSFDRMINSFHANLYTKPIATLERSPAFRTAYYQWVDKLAISMDEAAINKIIDDISSRVSDPENYLTPGLWAKLQDLKANPSKLYGTLSAKEVSSYASGAALDEYMKTVYNAVDRRNVTDVMRVISPFAQQHAEFMARVGRLAFVPVKGGELGYLPNANTFRKMQLAIEGGKEADPDGDGRGIFFKDPTTGELSFQFPLTGKLTKMITGVEAPVTASVRGVAMGFDMKPGFGPFATVAASKLLADTPSLDWVRSILLPYGERNNVIQAVTPSWVEKAYNGLVGDGRFFANTYAETNQALAASGKYDLSNPNERDKMLQEAKDKARIFVVLRAATQFTGPAAGDVDIKAPTKQGDIYASGLSAALQSLRNLNYDTANLRFIEIFGEDAFTYLSNKTTSEVGGLLASKEFGNFERTNENLFRQYQDIAGYFGPIGTAFDYEVYTRQLQTGARTRLSPEEILKASDRAIGLAYYRDMKEHLGPNLNKQAQDYLANYKKEIIKKYPGFGDMQFDPNKTPKDIEKLFQAAKMDSLKNNKTAEAVLYYEQIRNAALEEANRRGFKSLKSDKLGDLHEYLNSYAESIITKYPDFARVFDRLLSREIDQ